MCIHTDMHVQVFVRLLNRPQFSKVFKMKMGVWVAGGDAPISSDHSDQQWRFNFIVL